MIPVDHQKVDVGKPFLKTVIEYPLSVYGKMSLKVEPGKVTQFDVSFDPAKLACTPLEEGIPGFSHSY
tara:strand:+ start:37 stop:240 length:204 start_codon:yes stop_codon:yes gene_type:complete